MEKSKKAENQSRDSDRLLMRSIIAFSWLLLVLFSGGGWYLYSASFGVSVVAGGVLANVSFLLLKKDLEGLFTKVSQAGGAAAAVSQTEKIRFFIKFYARLVILGLLLILLVSKFSIHMIGLSLGLATVMLSVIVVVLSRGRSFYSVQSLRSV